MKGCRVEDGERVRVRGGGRERDRDRDRDRDVDGERENKTNGGQYNTLKEAKITQHI